MASSDAERRELERVLRGWLLKRPKPASLRIVVADEPRAVAIPPNATFATIAASVVRLRPDQIEALDPSGAVLRVTDFGELTGEEDGDERLPGAPTLPTPAPAAPLEPLTVPPDPESQRFALVARLLADAYRHSTDVAFERIAGIIDRSEARAASLERAVDAMYRAQRAALERTARDLEEREEEIEEAEDKKGNGAIDKLVEHFAESFSDDDAGDKGQPQPNGKAH
jgi:hypothetical protein